MRHLHEDIVLDLISKAAEECFSNKRYETGQALLRKFAAAGQLTCLINRTLENSGLLAAIASQSFHHAFDFDKILLLQGENWRLRIHFWDPICLERSHNPHAHRWDLTSMVLAGRMINETWQEHNIGVPHERWLVSATHIGKERDIKPDGRVCLVRTDLQTIEAGQSYFHPRRLPHVFVIPAGTRTITLALTGPAGNVMTPSYTPLGKSPTGEETLVPMEATQVQRRFEQMLRLAG